MNSCMRILLIFEIISSAYLCLRDEVILAKLGNGDWHTGLMARGQLMARFGSIVQGFDRNVNVKLAVGSLQRWGRRKSVLTSNTLDNSAMSKANFVIRR